MMPCRVLVKYRNYLMLFLIISKPVTRILNNEHRWLESSRGSGSMPSLENFGFFEAQIYAITSISSIRYFHKFLNAYQTQWIFTRKQELFFDCCIITFWFNFSSVHGPIQAYHIWAENSRLFDARDTNIYKIQKLRRAIYFPLYLQHFVTNLCNFTTFKMLFSAKVKDFVHIVWIKI